MFPQPLKLLHVIGKEQGLLQAFKHQPWSTLLSIPKGCLRGDGVSRTQHESWVPYGGFGMWFAFNAFASPSGSTLVLLTPCDSRLFSWRFLCGLGYLPFFKALSQLPPFPFLLRGICSRNVRWGRSRWPRYNGHQEHHPQCGQWVRPTSQAFSPLVP